MREDRGPTLRRWRSLLAVAALALVLPVTACGGSDSESSSGGSGGSGSEGSGGSESLPVVRFQGLSDGMSAISLKVIELQKFDEKNGFKGEFQYIPADSSTQNFLLGKSDFDLDAGPPDLAVAASKNYDVVSFTAAAKNHVVVVAPNDSPYQNMEDLKGKTIGWFGSDSTAALTIQMLLGEKGIDFFNDYKFAQAAPSALVPLLKSGQVDAIVTFQPWASWANSEVEGGVRTVYDPNAAWQESHPDGTIWTTIGAAHRKWLEQNPDLAAKAEQAWCDAAEYMNANMKEIVQEPEVQELLDPVKPETGLNTMAEYVQQNQLFQCGWTEAQTKDVNAFLDQIADQGKLFKQNPGDLFAPLEELTG